MKALLVISLLVFPLFSMAEEEISADQLEALSECDFFKYQECTGAGLNIGACIKNKYDEFVKVCGKVHADNFMYSSEMFRPKKVKVKKKSCDSLMDELCFKNSLSISQCSAKYKKELGEACGGEDFLKNAAAANEMDECFDLRNKICGKENTPECEEIFQAKAPKKCTGDIEISSKKSKEGLPSSAELYKDCEATIKSSPCKIDEEEISKEGVDVQAYLRKYRVCLEKNLMKAKGDCGAHFPDAKATKEKMEAQRKAGKVWNKPED